MKIVIESEHEHFRMVCFMSPAQWAAVTSFLKTLFNFNFDLPDDATIEITREG